MKIMKTAPTINALLLIALIIFAIYAVLDKNTLDYLEAIEQNHAVQTDPCEYEYFYEKLAEGYIGLCQKANGTRYIQSSVQIPDNELKEAIITRLANRLDEVTSH